MAPRRLVAALATLALATACTGGGEDAGASAAATAAAPVVEATETTSTEPASPGPAETETPEVRFGTGTVTVDGTEVPVSGDCDISREFGEQPVDSLAEDVDVLLAVDNVAGDGSHDGPFALQVRLLGDGEVTGRTVTSQGAAGPDGATATATYEGTVDVATLRDRRELEFLDVATLHLEASQERVAGSDGPAGRSLVVDVTCPISRPG